MTEHEIPSAILPAPRKAWIHRATSGEHDSAYLGEELPEALARLDGGTGSNFGITKQDRQQNKSLQRSFCCPHSTVFSIK
jgi:hypothetical protein